jgi:hypothetical protein
MRISLPRTSAALGLGLCIMLSLQLLAPELCRAQAFPSVPQNGSDHAPLVCTASACWTAGSFLGQMGSAGKRSLGKADVFVAAFDPATARPLWVATGGSPSDDHAIDLIPDGNGGAILTALVSDSAVFGQLPAIRCAGPGMCEVQVSVDASGRFTAVHNTHSDRTSNLRVQVTENGSIMLSAADPSAGPGRIDRNTVIGAKKPIQIETPTRPQMAPPSEDRLTCTTYPNPATGGDLQLLVRQQDVSTTGPALLQLTDMKGVAAISETVRPDSPLWLHRMDITQLPAGTYTLRLAQTDPARACAVNFIKQ